MIGKNIVLLLACLTCAPFAAADPINKSSTVGGEFRITWSENNPECRFYLNNKPIKNLDCEYAYSPELIGDFKGGLGLFDEVLVVQEFPQGNACNGGPIHFVGVRTNGTYSISKPLDFCGGKNPIVKRTGKVIEITFPGGPPNRGADAIPAERWEYQDGKIKRAK